MERGGPAWRMMGALAAVVALGAGARTAAAQELYVMYGGDEPYLLRVDGPTGVVNDSIPITGALDLRRGLAMRWDGMLFAIDRIANDDYRLFKFSPETGEGQVVGGPIAMDGIMAIAADPGTGRLYGVSQSNDLYRIDHLTGEAALIGHIEADEFDIVFAMGIGRDGVGYVTDGWYVAMARLDLETAEAEFVCHLGSQNWFNDMAFDDENAMWGIFELDGSVRRHGVGPCSGGVLYDGFYGAWGIEVVPEQAGCYPDCNGDEDLSLFDFLCFVNTFNAGSDDADCDGSGALDLFDFLCFVNEFNEGC